MRNEDRFCNRQAEAAGQAALARQEVFVELTDHPMWHCDPIGMPLAMDTGAPIEFIDRGEEIHLRLEQNDSLRVIHLNPDIDPARKSSGCPWRGYDCLESSFGIER